MRTATALVGAFGIAVFFASPRLSAQEGLQAEIAAADEVIKGRSDGAQRMTVPVGLEGHGPFRFVIDTGSQTTVVGDELAERLALPPGPQVSILDIGGREIVDTVIVGELKIGSRTMTGIHAPKLQTDDIGADGVLGIDSLQKQRVLLDLGRNLMALGTARDLGGNRGFEIVVTARRRYGQLIIANASIDGVRTSLVIDTGSDTSIGNRALQAALGKRGRNATVNLVTASGKQVVADLGLPKRIEIDTFSLGNPLVAYVDSPIFAALELENRPALLLGMRELRLFQRVAIDFKVNRVYFDMPDRLRSRFPPR